MSDWKHYAILELFKLEHFENSLAWMAKQLGISCPEIEDGLARLERLRLIHKKDNGKDELVSKNFSIVHTGFTSVAKRRLQRQMLEHSLLALDSIEYEARGHSTIVVAMPLNKLPELREKIRRFRREIDFFLEQQTSKDAVYQIQFSFYPLTTVDQNDVKRMSTETASSTSTGFEPTELQNSY